MIRKNVEKVKIIKSYDLLYVKNTIKDIDKCAKQMLSIEDFFNTSINHNRAELFYFVMLRETCRLYGYKLISKNLLVSYRKKIISKYENFYLWDIISDNNIEKIKEIKNFNPNSNCKYCNKLKEIVVDVISNFKFTSLKRANRRKKILLSIVDYNYYNINIDNLFSHTEKFYYYVSKELLMNKNKEILSENDFENEMNIINNKFNNYTKYDDANKLYTILERKVELLTKDIITNGCPVCKKEMFSLCGLN